MYNENAILEIHETIQNLLNSSISAKEISEKCDISYTTISELKNNKRGVDTTSFKNINSLYHFAIDHQLSEEYLKKERLKGTHKFIPIEIPMKKIIVAFNELELFPLGILTSENEIPLIPLSMDAVYPISLPNSGVVIDQYNRVYDAYQLGLNFKTKYNGGGPNTFIRFLHEYSKIPLSELNRTIHNEAIVEYNFDSDTLTPLDSKLPEIPFRLYKKKEKLIIAIQGDSEYFPFNPEFSENKMDILEQTLKSLISTLSDVYQFNIEPIALHYVPNQANNSIEYNTSPNSYSYIHNDQYHMIFEFGMFEIWLPYLLPVSEGNPFKHPIYQRLIQSLGYTYEEEQEQTFLNKIRQQYELYKESKEPLKETVSIFF